MLSVWFMDDGSRCRESDVYLNTQQFDAESQSILLKSLLEIGLHATLNKDKEYKRIRFLTKKYRKYTRPLLKKHRKLEHTLTQLFHIHIASSLTLYKQNYSNSLIKRSPNSSK